MAHKFEKNIEGTYKQLLSWRYDRVQLIGLPSLKDNRDLWLEEIYVPLGFTRKPGSDEKRFYLPKAMSESRHLVILGDPGSGKSTLVKLITHAFGRSASSSLPQHFGPLLPIPIILRDYKVGEWNSFEDMLRSFIKQLDEEIRDSITVEWLSEYLTKGQAIVLLDGIDEIGSAEARRHLRDKVVAPLIRKFPDSYLILTSRIIGFEEVPFDQIRFSEKPDSESDEPLHMFGAYANSPISVSLARCYVAPFNNEDIEQFIVRWYTARETDSAQRSEGIESLKRALAQNDRVKRLAGNPSLLTLIALIHRVTANLPSGRVKLYDKITEAYLETIEKFRRVGEHPASLEQKRRWLARVGWKMQSHRTEKSQGDLLASRRAVHKWLTEAIADERENAEAEADTFLDYIARRSGLLIPRGVDDAGEDQFSFVHLTFQEYFAALHLRGMAWDFNEVVKPVLENLTKRYWHETILVLFEMLADMRGSGDRLVKILIEKAKQPDEQQAAAEIFSALLLDSESGLSPAGQQHATEFARDAVCQQVNNTITGNLKELPSSNFDRWVGKPMLDKLRHTKPTQFACDFLLAGKFLITDWPDRVKEVVGGHGNEPWPYEQIAIATLVSAESKEVVEWASEHLPLTWWLKSIHWGSDCFSISLAEFHLPFIFSLETISPRHRLLAQMALAFSNNGSQILKLMIQARFLKRRFNIPWAESLNWSQHISIHLFPNRSQDITRDRSWVRFLIRFWAWNWDQFWDQEYAWSDTREIARSIMVAILSSPLNNPNHSQTRNTDSMPTELSALVEWLAFQPDCESQRLATLQQLHPFQKAKDDWTRLLAINNLITLSAGTPELVAERNRLCDLAMKTPEKFTFPDELVEATKDKEWFNLPEIIAIIFLHEHGDPFLKPEWFDPKSEESKFFLSTPREFFALAAEVLDPKGETDLAKWRKS